jgi:hypothetical protein
MDRPRPPDELPKYIVEGLARQDVKSLQLVEEYVGSMIEYKIQQAEDELDERATGRLDDDLDDDEFEQALEDAREDGDVPSGATVTVKTIDERDYYYYQWREGSDIRSKYIAPVSPAND